MEFNLSSLLVAAPYLISGPLILSAFLGALIGLEREVAGKDPSLRTFALISLGSCLFSLISHSSVQDYHMGDPSRIGAQIVTGIGFIGAGAIFRAQFGVKGLTTAALMWATAGIGMAVGYGYYTLATSATFSALFITFSLNRVHRILRFYRKKRGITVKKEVDTLQDIE